MRLLDQTFNQGQQWSSWQQQADDCCTHCGELLDSRASQEAHEYTQRAQQPSAGLKLKLDIKPEDGSGTRLLKRLAYGGQFLFAAIMSVLVSLAAAAAA